MTQRINLHFSLDQDVPEWVQLVPHGSFKGGDGRGPYFVGDAEAFIDLSMKAGKLPIDENHAIDLAAPGGQPSPARGWIVALEAREGAGIWGKVDWTETGKGLLKDRSYRGISPALMTRENGEVIGIARASLVNDPNLTLATLHFQEKEPGMSLANTLRASLSLAAAATDEAIVAAVSELHASNAALKADLAKVAAAAGAAETADAGAIVLALQSRSNAAGELEAMKKTVLELQTKLQAGESERSIAKATAFVDKAIAEGKPIKPLRDHYIARHAKEAEAVEKEINALTSINAGGITVPPKGEGAGVAAGKSATEIAAAAQLHMRQQKEMGAEIEYGAAVRFVTGT